MLNRLNYPLLRQYGSEQTAKNDKKHNCIEKYVVNCFFLSRKSVHWCIYKLHTSINDFSLAFYSPTYCLKLSTNVYIM